MSQLCIDHFHKRLNSLWITYIAGEIDILVSSFIIRDYNWIWLVARDSDGWGLIICPFEELSAHCNDMQRLISESSIYFPTNRSIICYRASKSQWLIDQGFSCNHGKQEECMPSWPSLAGQPLLLWCMGLASKTSQHGHSYHLCGGHVPRKTNYSKMWFSYPLLLTWTIKN